MASPLTDDGAAPHHSHLHYAMGTTITVADVATFGTALYILSMSLQLFLTWKLMDYKIQEQAGILLLIAVCIYVASRLIIWLLRLLHKAVTRWEELAATMRKEDVGWFRRNLLAGVRWAQRIPADLPKASDFYVRAVPVELESITVNPSEYVFEEDEEDLSVSAAPPTPKQGEGKKKGTSGSAKKYTKGSRPAF